MRRQFFPLLVIGLVLLAAAALFLLVNRQTPVPTPSIARPEAESVDPLMKEMNCVDRVLQDRNLRSEQVQPALDRCRSEAGSGGAELNGVR